MKFGLGCGHTREIHPTHPDPYIFMRVIREGCMRCVLESKTTSELRVVDGKAVWVTVPVEIITAPTSERN